MPISVIAGPPIGAIASSQTTISKDEVLTEVGALNTNYKTANDYISNDANWADNKMVGLANYLKRDFWRFFEWTVAFQGSVPFRLSETSQCFSDSH